MIPCLFAGYCVMKATILFIKNYGISILFVFHLVMPVGKQNENIMKMFKVIILVLTERSTA